MIKRHTRPNPQKNIKGGILERESAIHVSNVMLVDADSSTPSRMGAQQQADGTKVRVRRKRGVTPMSDAEDEPAAGPVPEGRRAGPVEGIRLHAT